MKIAYIFFSAVLLLACNNDREEQKNTGTNKTNTPTANTGAVKEPYGLAVPVGWTTEHRRFAGVDYYFILAPKTFQDLNTTINIITEKMQNMTLPDFMAHTIEMVKQSIPTAVIQRQGAITAQGGLKGLWYSYHMEPEGVKMTVTSYIFQKEGTAYILTASTQEKDAEAHRNTFDGVAMSFHFN